MLKINSKILSQEKQLELLRKWKSTGSEIAFNRLVESNYRSVTKLAYKYSRNNPKLDIEDLIQQGLLGLTKAANKFDLSKDVGFLTYAHYWIDQSIRSYVMDNRNIIRLGTTADGRKIFNSLSKVKKEAEACCDTQEEILNFISKKLDVKKENLVKMMNMLGGGDVSLDKKVSNTEEDSPTVGDMISSDDDQSPEEINELSERNNILDNIIEENLNEVEKIIIKSRFFSNPTLTYEVIGDAISLSRQKVKEIEGNCYKRIKNILKSEYKVYDMSEII